MDWGWDPKERPGPPSGAFSTITFLSCREHQLPSPLQRPKPSQRLFPPWHTPLHKDTQPSWDRAQPPHLFAHPLGICTGASLRNLGQILKLSQFFQGKFWKNQQEHCIHNTLTRKTCAVLCSIAGKCGILHSEGKKGLLKSREKSAVCYNNMPLFM